MEKNNKTGQQAGTDNSLSGSPISVFNVFGSDLERMILLRTYPIAIKMLSGDGEIPDGAIRPKKDLGEHYAMCQAISLARRQGKTLAMFAEDHWCFEPIISYGLVEPPQNYLDGDISSFFIANKDAARKRDEANKRLPFGKYTGMILGPLNNVNYVPDLVMIYCNTGQLRHLLFSLIHVNGRRVTSTFDPIGSCVHSVVPSLLSDDCYITVPDPGDFERGMAGEDEMILTVPVSKMKELMDGVYHFEKKNMGYRKFGRLMASDFQQPPFYQDYFKQWGLDSPKKK